MNVVIVCCTSILADYLLLIFAFGWLQSVELVRLLTRRCNGVSPRLRWNNESRPLGAAFEKKHALSVPLYRTALKLYRNRYQAPFGKLVKSLLLIIIALQLVLLAE